MDNLDVNFHEDDNSTMNKNAFNNLSIINKMVLSSMKIAQPILGNNSIRLMRKQFGWGTEDTVSKVLNAFDDKTLLESILTQTKSSFYKSSTFFVDPKKKYVKSKECQL